MSEYIYNNDGSNYSGGVAGELFTGRVFGAASGAVMQGVWPLAGYMGDIPLDTFLSS